MNQAMKRGPLVTLVVAAIAQKKLFMQSDSRLTTLYRKHTTFITDSAQKIFYLTNAHLLLATSGHYSLNFQGHATTIQELSVWLAHQKRLQTLPQVQAKLTELMTHTPLATNQFLLGGFIKQQPLLSRYDNGHWQSFKSVTAHHVTTYIGQGTHLATTQTYVPTIPIEKRLTQQLTVAIRQQQRTQNVPTIGGPLQYWCLTANHATHNPVV